MDYGKVASEVITAVGKDNLVAAAHCATRLRLVLKDDSKVDQKALDKNADVKGTFKTDGQYQVIIGPGDVNFVYDEIIKQTGLTEVSTDDLKKIAASGKKFNPIMALIKLLSDIFVPIIPALVAGGLLMALNNFLTSEGLFGTKSLVQQFPIIKGSSDMIQLMSAAPFWFLPILVGISAAKRFGANQFLGASIGMIMVAPGAANIIGLAANAPISKAATIGAYTGFWNIFGLHVTQASYTYQVIPVLVAVWLLSILEKFFHKRLPSAVDFTFTPLLSVIITGFLTFIVIGPVMKEVSDWLTNGIVWLYDTTGFLGMGVFGALYSPVVMTGLHQSFPAIETQLISAFQNGTGHGDFIFVTASMANVAQGAATFAIYFLTKDKKMKGLSSSSGVSALLGITEPALFGVNLKYRFPFFCALIGSASAAAIAGLLQVVAVSLGSAGFLGFLSIKASSIPFYVVCELISFAIAFAVTYGYGKTKAVDVFAAEAAVEEAIEEVQEIPEEAASAANKAQVTDEVLAAPLAGEAVELTSVNDPVFSSEAMGKGIAIKPSGNTVKGFEQKVQADQKVKKGDVLGTFDSDKIAEAGLDNTTMFIVTNTADYASVETLASSGTVAVGDSLLEVKK